MISSRLTKLATVAFAATILAGSAGSAFAETQWEADHPRRDQVNDRLHNQDRRINQERREGEISRSQARQLHRKDRHIRQEERRMASRDGGHITAHDQHVLNRQENRVSRQIGR
ncbi:MAG: hypothetical protein ACHQK9_16450 [Reyranellales bacterium]